MLDVYNDVLLTSEEFVKSYSNISNNVNGKYLRVAIREAQEIELREILGSCLLNKLKALVEAEELDQPENGIYMEIIDQCQYFLAYTAVKNLCLTTSYKIDNIGVSQTYDENIQSMSLEDTYNIMEQYARKADYFCHLLQEFLISRKEFIPELTDSQCSCIQANLYHAATGGIWMGGRRGKYSERGCCKGGRTE